MRIRYFLKLNKIFFIFEVNLIKSMEFLSEHFSPEILIKVGITIFICVATIIALKRAVSIYFGRKLSNQSKMIFGKIINFIGISVMLIVIISQLGFSSLFTTALGTAGVVGVAIGFASKTSLENIISGVLLLSDKSFKIGDKILVGDVEGTVQAIDSLSVKMLTYDNKLVRVPNVKLLNSEVTNLYPHNERRRDFYFKVSYQTDVEKVTSLLKEVANNNPYAIRKDETYVYFRSYDNLGFQIKYGVWFEKGNITPLSNTISQDISEAFKKEGIEIPVPLLNID